MEERWGMGIAVVLLKCEAEELLMPIQRAGRRSVNKKFSERRGGAGVFAAGRMCDDSIPLLTKRGDGAL
jgi:hypothetical protein